MLGRGQHTRRGKCTKQEKTHTRSDRYGCDPVRRRQHGGDIAFISSQSQTSHTLFQACVCKCSCWPRLSQPNLGGVPICKEHKKQCNKIPTRHNSLGYYFSCPHGSRGTQVSSTFDYMIFDEAQDLTPCQSAAFWKNQPDCVCYLLGLRVGCRQYFRAPSHMQRSTAAGITAARLRFIPGNQRGVPSSAFKKSKRVFHAASSSARVNTTPWAAMSDIFSAARQRLRRGCSDAP